MTASNQMLALPHIRSFFSLYGYLQDMTSRLDLGLHIIVLMLNESLSVHKLFSSLTIAVHMSWQTGKQQTILAGSEQSSTQEPPHYDSIIRRLSSQDIYSSTEILWRNRILWKRSEDKASDAFCLRCISTLFLRIVKYLIRTCQKLYST